MASSAATSPNPVDCGPPAYDCQYGPPLLVDCPQIAKDALPVFEIGLVLAGAVSAGAYLGGVLDFLFEAMDAFEKAKGAARASHGSDYAKWQVPAHDVRIKVVSGASAGSMTAVAIAASAPWDFPHIHNDQEAAAQGSKNPFYNMWVRQIDMRPLLGDLDLKGDGPLHSLLDCTILNDIKDRVLAFTGTARPSHRAWLAEPLKIVMAITNMRGIPYSFPFPGSPGGVYSMTRHDDLLRFSLSTGGKIARRDEIAIDIDLGGKVRNPAWQVLGDACLASGSFPIALRSRTIAPPADIYRSSYFIDMSYGACDAAALVKEQAANKLSPHQAMAVASVLHAAETRDPDHPSLSYASADGGMIDNEPLELARIELAGILGRNPREAKDALRAVLMIDPFPDPPAGIEFEDADTTSIFALVNGMLGAMKNQGRFHPDDIRLATAPNVYSRFIISPSRTAGDGKTLTGGAAMSCGALGGFSGFLDQSYRHHDFLLGRANCRQFLEEIFAMPVMADGAPVALFIRNPGPLSCDSNDPEGRIRPILPLVTPPPAFTPAWPAERFQPEQLRDAIEARVGAVGRKLIGRIDNKAWSIALGVIWSAGGGAIVRKLASKEFLSKIRGALKAHGLLSGGA